MKNGATRNWAIAAVVAVTLAGCGASAGKPTAAAPAATASTAKAGPGLVPYQGDGFTVGLPGSPKKQEQTKQTAAGPVTVTILTVVQGQRAFAVAYNPIPGSATYDLDQAVNATVSGIGGAVADVKTVTFKGAQGRDYRITGAGGGKGTAFGRVLVVGSRLFQFEAVVPGGNVSSVPPEYPAMLASLSF